jgi:hypothetical protein
LFERERYRIPYKMRKISDFIDKNDKYLSSFNDTSNFYENVFFSETNIVGDCHYFSEEIQKVCQNNNVTFFFGSELNSIKKIGKEELIIKCNQSGNQNIVEINTKNGKIILF